MVSGQTDVCPASLPRTYPSLIRTYSAPAGLLVAAVSMSLLSVFSLKILRILKYLAGKFKALNFEGIEFGRLCPYATKRSFSIG